MLEFITYAWPPVNAAINVGVPPAAGPLVLSFDPADDAIDVAIDADFSITFDQNIQAAAAASFRLYNSGGLVEELDETDFGGALSISTDTLTINWTDNLANLTGYYVLADAGSVEDLSANPWQGGIWDPVTWNITTVAAGGGGFPDNNTGASEYQLLFAA